MTGSGYKKYMKKNAQRKDYSLVRLFVMSFLGMLLLFTVLIKAFSPSVDVSIGDYKQEESDVEEKIVNVDDRLAAIQDEDQGKSFADLMKKAEDIQPEQVETKVQEEVKNSASKQREKDEQKSQKQQKSAESEVVYKVYIGTYTSAEQAKVAKDIIQETNLNLNPIVKCIGSNNYTLQVGIFKNKNGAETLLSSIQQNHLPGRIVQED